MKRMKFWIGGAVAMLALTGVALAGQGATTSTPSATFDGNSTGGFSDGKLGTGASVNEALIFGGGCTGDKPDKAPKTANRSDARPTDQTAPQDGGSRKK